MHPEKIDQRNHWSVSEERARLFRIEKEIPIKASHCWASAIWCLPHKIMSHCNSYHEREKKKKSGHKKSVCVGKRKWNPTLTEWLFLPCGQARTDTANLAEMWMGDGNNGFLRRKRARENDSEGRGKR